MVKQKIKVAVCYAILYRFRVPIFQRLATNPGLTVKYFVGSGVKGAKDASTDNETGLDVVKMFTLGVSVVSSGRLVPLTFNPALLFHLFKTNPDVVIVQGGEVPNNIVILAYAKIFKKPVIWWSLGEVQGRTYGKAGRIYRKLVQFIERKCDVFLGYSSASGKYFLDQGYNPGLIYSLVNVVDTDKVKALIPQDKLNVAPLKKNLGITDEIIMLFVGKLTETKDITRLINATIDIKDINYRLVIVGDGPEKMEAEKLVIKKKLENHVSFTGSVYEGVGAYFELADFLVMPGTGGLVISEAMTHSLPIVCSTGDGSEQDLVINGKNGFIVPSNDITILSSTLRSCLESPIVLKEMGKQSFEIITKKHNINSFMNTMHNAVKCAHKSI